jgi:hypothetical protein
MPWPPPLLRLLIRALQHSCQQIFLLVAFCLIGAVVHAQSIESVLSPGKLIAGHAKLEDQCNNCHVRFDRKAQDGLCMSCHKDVGADMRAKTGFHGRLKPQACNTCHTDHKGRDAQIVKLDKRSFDHAQTDFALRGKHQPVACEKCHASGKKYSEAPQDCNSCHKKDDVHKGGLGVKCADCHSETSWKETKFDHEKTRFSLTGKHQQAKCTDCHKNGQYKDTVRTCIGCHKKEDDSAKGHKGQFGEKCETCHGANAWKPSTFNHDTDTKFDLRGKHRNASCTDCHKGNLYRVKLSQDCYACHQKDDKHQGSLGKDCGSCHSERSWKEPPKFNHDKTDFPLLGKHIQAECKDCHKSNLFKEAPKDCYACHKKDDKHEATLGQDCKSCHSERGWKLTLGRFDHGKTKFPLREAHADDKLKCTACHKDLKSFRDTPIDCYACHKKDDKHEKTLGEDCKTCHSERNWKHTAGRFDHNKTKFALRNAHAEDKLKCNACHKDLKSFRNTPVDCYACHKKDDKHEGQQGQACEKCHNDRNWKDTRFDHNQTRFPLVGKHITVKCGDCHKSNRFKDAPSNCYGCHEKDDKHKKVFGVKCETCHNTRAWAIWDFDHNKRTEFKLDGAHLKLKCESCHTQPAPAQKHAAALDKTCISCHRKSDVHDGQFGMRCEQCHVTENWKRIKSRLGQADETVYERVAQLVRGQALAVWLAGGARRVQL